MHPHMWDLNNDGFLFLLPCYCDECVFFTCIFPHLLIPAPEHGSSSRTHTLHRIACRAFISFQYIIIACS